jgi:hypothetical protein
MSDFWIYVEIGLKHVLNIKAYDHVLFLMALTAAHSFQEWKRLLLLITLFTIGHTLALVLSVFNLVSINENLVEFLIPITILIAALFNFIALKKTLAKGTLKSVALTTLFFGLIHGMGFSNYFKTILPGNAIEKVLPLFEFSIGIEAAQMTVVLTILMLSYIAQSAFKATKRDFTIVTSAIIIGVVLPMIIDNEIWNHPLWN